MTLLKTLIDRWCERLDSRGADDGEPARDEFILQQLIPPADTRRKRRQAS